MKKSKAEDINYEDLYHYYIEENKSLRELENIFNCNRKYIGFRIKELNIAKSKELINECNKKHREETYLIKYGVKSNFQTDDFKNKSKQTCIDKYGVENAMQSKEIQKKAIETKKELYGNNYLSENMKDFWANSTDQYKAEIKNKIRETCISKYGTDNVMKLQEFQNKAKQTNIKRYGVEYYVQSNEYKEIVATRPKKIKIQTT